ncbi:MULTISPECIES: type IV pilus biogenesis protein PilM [Pseudidiomarina]|uniref:type IV pilus biogenesis protein PilM n=1 Tax=Pseudidiomarina TaxID=2800384 RepID=UPI00215B61EF|nr:MULTISPECIES: pilus assembly protein PilM [Pseudidiomarina]
MGLFGLGKKPGLGIDIGTDAIKAVEIVPQGDTYEIIRVAESQLPKNLITDDEITDIDKVARALKQTKKALGTRALDVVSSVSGSQAISKQIAVALELDDDAISEKIETEAEALIPYPLAEVRYDFESLGEHPTMPGQQRVLVTATRTMSVDSRVQALEEAGFKVRIMDVDNQAILRACDHVMPHLYPDLYDNKLPLLVLDISGAAVQMIVIGGGEVMYTRYQSGGLGALLGALDNEGELDHGELFAKLRADETEEFSPLVLQDFLGNLWSQISRGMQIYRSNATKKDFAGIVLVNSGAMLPMIATMLGEQVEYPVISLNPFEHFPLPSKYQHLEAHGPRFVEALGLALRSFTEWHT